MSARNNKNTYGERDDHGHLSQSNNNTRKPGTWVNQDDENDLELIQQKIGKIENDSLASTQRSLRMLNETEEIGANTAQVIAIVFILINKMKW